MDGAKCLSVKTLQDISTNIENYKFDWDFFYPNSNLYLGIYKSSIISQEEHYYNCALLSYKTHNSQRDLDNLEYYVFNNLTVYLTKIIDLENGAKQDNEDNPNEQFESMQRSVSNMQKSMMSNAKSQFKIK